MDSDKLTAYQDYYEQRMDEIKAEQLANGKEFRPNKYRQRPAREWVRKYLSTGNNIENIPYEIREALSVLFIETKREIAKKAANSRFMEMFLYEGHEVSAINVFKETGLGVGECQGIINRRLSRTTPNNRMWISVNKESDIVYRLEAIGAAMPEGWVGYVPNDKIEL